MNKKDYIYLGIILVLVLNLGVVSYKYKEQSTKQMNKCYQMFELFREAITEETENDKWALIWIIKYII